jgi:4'-phosphopantetheinyl transferase
MPDLRAALELGEVRVLYAASAGVADEGAKERCRAMLSAEERARHIRFHFEQDQHSYLAAHALTRGVLGRLLGADPAELRFESGEHGRPELCWPDRRPRMRFNLSHTRGLVACAVALEHDVGVDVEQIDRRVEIDQLARSVFSTAEREGLAALDGDRKRQRFFELWTLKEAYIKAVGKGLALPLHAISVQLDAGQRPRIGFAAPIADDGARWWLHVRQPLGSYMLAVAVASPAPTLELQELYPWK